MHPDSSAVAVRGRGDGGDAAAEPGGRGGWLRAGRGGDQSGGGAAGHTAAAPAQASLAKLSLKWALQRSGVSGVVVGARTEQQLTELVGAATDGVALDAVMLQQLDAVHMAYPNPCP